MHKDVVFLEFLIFFSYFELKWNRVFWEMTAPACGVTLHWVVLPELL